MPPGQSSLVPNDSRLRNYYELNAAETTVGTVSFGPAKVNFLPDYIVWQAAPDKALFDGSCPIITIPAWRPYLISISTKDLAGSQYGPHTSFPSPLKFKADIAHPEDEMNLSHQSSFSTTPQPFGFQGGASGLRTSSRSHRSSSRSKDTQESTAEEAQ